MSTSYDHAQRFLDLAYEHRGKLTPSDRCAAVLRQLKPFYMVRMPEAAESSYQLIVDSLYSGHFQDVGGDQALAGFIAESDSPLAEGMQPDCAPIFVATAYAVEAIKRDRDGRRDEAWSLAFDAAQWQGFVSGVATFGDAELVQETMRKMANVQSGASTGGKKGAEARAKDAVDTEAVVRAARLLGWPTATKDIYKTVAKSFEVTADRIGQILRDEVKKPNTN